MKICASVVWPKMLNKRMNGRRDFFEILAQPKLGKERAYTLNTLPSLFVKIEAFTFYHVEILKTISTRRSPGASKRG